jgi:hypothetical protein
VVATRYCFAAFLLLLSVHLARRSRRVQELQRQRVQRAPRTDQERATRAPAMLLLLLFLYIRFSRLAIARNHIFYIVCTCVAMRIAFAFAPHPVFSAICQTPRIHS